VSRVQTSEGVIGVADNGSAAGPPILFLHGVGSTKAVWRPQLEHFRGSRTAIAMDYPGYGEGDFRDRATRDDFARAAWSLLDALCHSQAHVCVLSLGVVVAIAMHALAPERCRSLILADSFAVHPQGKAIYDRSVAASDDMRALAEGRVDVLLANPDTAVKQDVIETMAGIDPAAYRLGAEAVWLADQQDRARAIQVPTLVLVGSADPVTPPALSKDLAELIDGARYVELPGASHLANLDRPDLFNREVERFITEIEQKKLALPGL
jgi:3-oxoadipate enol-lactonase